MFLSGLKCLSRLERQVKFAKNRCCKIKPAKFVITSIRSAQNQRIVYFFIDSPILFFRKTYVFDICKNRLAEAILTNTQNV